LFLFSNNKISNIDEINNQNNNQNSSSTNSGEFYFEGLIKVWDKPVAGYNISNNKNYIQTVLSFVDSNTGTIYQKDLSIPTSTASQITLSDQNYLNIYKAYFINDNNGIVKKVIMQYLNSNKVIKTIIATMPTYFNTPAKLENIISLPDNITNISISPDNKKLIYLVSKQTNIGGEKDVYSDWYFIDNSFVNPNQVFSSPLTIWNLSITNAGDIYASEIDTAFELNSLYKLNIVKENNNYLSNNLVKLYGEHTGLSFLINQNNILVSANTGSGIKTYLSNLFFGNKFEDNNLKELDIKTLAKKCVFADNKNFILCAAPKDLGSYDSGLPDAWYQGVANFSDDIYFLNTFNGDSNNFYSLSENAGTSFDAFNLKISSNGERLILINKYDRNLWSLNIENLLKNTGE